MNIQQLAKVFLMISTLAYSTLILAKDTGEGKEIVRCTKKFWWKNMPSTEVDLHKQIKGEYIVMADDKYLSVVDGQSLEVVVKMKVREKRRIAFQHGLGIQFLGADPTASILPTIAKELSYDIERRMITFRGFFEAGLESFFNRELVCHDVRGDVTQFMDLFKVKEKKEERALPKLRVTKTEDLEILYLGHEGEVQEYTGFASSRCNVAFEQDVGLDTNASSGLQALQSWTLGSVYADPQMSVSQHVELCQGLAQRFKVGYLDEQAMPNPTKIKKQVNLLPPLLYESNIQGLAPFERAILVPEQVTLVSHLNQWLCVAMFNQADSWPGGGPNAHIQWRLQGTQKEARENCAHLLATYQTKYIDRLENPVELYRSYFLEIVEDQHQ